MFCVYREDLFKTSLSSCISYIYIYVIIICRSHTDIHDQNNNYILLYRTYTSPQLWVIRNANNIYITHKAQMFNQPQTHNCASSLTMQTDTHTHIHCEGLLSAIPLHTTRTMVTTITSRFSRSTHRERSTRNSSQTACANKYTHRHKAQLTFTQEFVEAQTIILNTHTNNLYFPLDLLHDIQGAPGISRSTGRVRFLLIVPLNWHSAELLTAALKHCSSYTNAHTNIHILYIRRYAVQKYVSSI